MILIWFTEDLLWAFIDITNNMVNKVYDDVGKTVDIADQLILDTQAALQACVALSEAEQVSQCLSELHQVFTLQKEEAVHRVATECDLGQQTVKLAIEKQAKFEEGNRQFVIESSNVTRSELTKCIQSL